MNKPIRSFEKKLKQKRLGLSRRALLVSYTEHLREEGYLKDEKE